MANFDNTTPHPAKLYDSQIRDTIPYYDSFHRETINLIKAINIKPETWLDTGCGTGSLVEKALEEFPDTNFILANPSAEMLTIARKRLAGMGRVRFLEPVPTQQLPAGNIGNCDVITAIQSHHYLPVEGRAKATNICNGLLSAGGVYVTFENVRPMTERGIETGKEYWRQFQLSRGRDADTVDAHIRRFNAEYFPITVMDHISLMRGAGFSTVELLWYSYMQAGFYGTK